MHRLAVRPSHHVSTPGQKNHALQASFTCQANSKGPNHRQLRTPLPLHSKWNCEEHHLLMRKVLASTPYEPPAGFLICTTILGHRSCADPDLVQKHEVLRGDMLY